MLDRVASALKKTAGLLNLGGGKMALVIAVENIKCGGCANTIQKALMAVAGVEAVHVAIDEGVIEVSVEPEVNEQEVLKTLKKKLLDMGYPEVGSVDGLKSAGAKAKSFISCAVGKLSDQ